MVGAYSKEDLIQINNFSHLHNGTTIIFCKTDFILQEFSNIEALEHDVIFITGNSDYCITDDLVQKAPKNIKSWFCQNKLSEHPLLTALPLGVENTVPCFREGHGYVWPHALEKPECLTHPASIPIKEVYANFRIETNPPHRSAVKSIIDDPSCNYISWKDSTLSYKEFVHDILNHKAVVCAQGNGLGDNHRIYETLYLGRVPLTFNKFQYEMLHHKYPVVLINDLEELKNKEEIMRRVMECKTNTKYLKFKYWEEMILDEAKKYNITR